MHTCFSKQSMEASRWAEAGPRAGQVADLTEEHLAQPQALSARGGGGDVRR